MIAAATAALEPLAFEALGSDTLLDRIDTKYLVPASQVPEILSEALGEYRILTYGGQSVSRYQTRYYDTADFQAYRDHRIGRAPRAKVRVRSYLDSDLSFLEVKWKTHRGRTTKVRERYSGDWCSAVAAFRSGPLAKYAEGIPWDRLQVAATITYDRVTLMHRAGSERVTIDLNLNFQNGDQEISHSGMAIIEVKQGWMNRGGISAVLRRRGIREASMSKYCLCIAQLFPDRVKTNEYRRLISIVRQLEASNNLLSRQQLTLP